MSINSTSPEEIQREYYARTAESYNDWHNSEGQSPEHEFALNVLTSFLPTLRINSVLNVGAGTGRTMLRLRHLFPDLQIIGLEPVKEMREVAVRNSVPESDIVGGNGTRMDFEDGQFDLVCAFGVLHHVTDPSAFVKEMLRVSNKAVFISDCNHVGQGSHSSRLIKRWLRKFKMFGIYEYLYTKGKGYRFSDDDGVYYFYSLFDDVPQIQSSCKTTHVFNTNKMNGTNLYYGSAHIGVFGIK